MRLEVLFARVPEAKPCFDVGQAFLSLFRDRDASSVEAFKGWLKRALSCEVGELRRFAKRLLPDRAAVEAALTLPWSNGQTEGQVTKLKLIKRQLYGRANFDPWHAKGGGCCSPSAALSSQALGNRSPYPYSLRLFLVSSFWVERTARKRP